MQDIRSIGVLQIFQGLEYEGMKAFQTVQQAVDEADRLWEEDHHKSYIVWNGAFEKVYQR